MHPEITDVVQRALAEDIGAGDVTSQACIPAHRRATGYFLAREWMVLAGTELIPLIYEARGGVESLEIHHHDGDHVNEAERVASVTGNARTLLECERVTLNFLQQLSGVATLANHYARLVEGTNCKILDTRKTVPGMRRLQKMAVAAGSATNHRMGLYDAILIKNNHIAAAGGIRQALQNANRSGLPIEIEVRTLDELHEALDCGANHLLLDNLSPMTAKEWIHLVNGRATVELSGGIDLDTARSYAETGADFISVGAITHSARAMDLSFRLQLL